MTPACFPSIIQLARGMPAEEKQILAICDFIDQRIDCADFRLICIHSSVIPSSSLTRL